MRSQLAVRLGSQTPTILHSPPGVVSLAAAEEAIELADAYGVADGYPLSDSQKLTIRNGGGERADGTWAATRIADFGPRQGTGKNDKIAAWELAHLLLFGTDLIIHTAHEFPTANESFLRLVSVFEAWDDLRRKVSRIRYANGEQGIELKTGQRLKYRARTGGSGRGFANAGLLIYDEAQHLTREHVAASGPAKLANPNSQTWYAGSGGLSTSRVAWDIRRAAVSGNGGRLAYTEMTAETVVLLPDGSAQFTPPVDVLDRDVWYATIPGLGRWVTEEGVEALYDELGEMFPREILCVWDADATDERESVMPGWDALADKDSAIESHRSWALAVSPDRKWAALGVAGRTVDGRLHVERMVDDRESQSGSARTPGTGWVVDRVVEGWESKGIPIRVAKSSPAAAFIPLLRERGVEVVEVPTTEYARAVGQVIDAVNAGTLVHLGQLSLNKAVRGAAVGGSNVWVQAGTVEVSPLEAVTLAAGGVPEGVGSAKAEPVFVVT